MATKLSLKTRTIILSLLLFLSCVVLFVGLHKKFPNYHLGQFGTHDFRQYWTAGQLLLNDKNPYNWDANSKLQKELGSESTLTLVTQNPPLLLSWLFPLFQYPFGVASFIWMSFNVFLILFCSLIIIVSGNPKFKLRNSLLPFLLSMLFPATHFTLFNGQISSLLLLGVTGFVVFYIKRRYVLAGLFMGLVAIKPHQAYLLWIFCGWVIIRHQNIKLFIGIGISIFLPLIFIIGQAPDIIPQYIDHMVDIQTKLSYKWYHPTIGSFLYRYVYQSVFIEFLPSLIAGIVFIFFLSKNQSIPQITVLHYAIMASLPTSPYGSWRSDMIIMIIPFLWGLSKLNSQNKSIICLSICLLLVNLGMYIQICIGFPGEPFSIWVPFVMALIYWNNNRRINIEPYQ